MNSLFYAARPILADMLSTFLFAGLFAWTHNVVLATGVGMAIGLGQVGWEFSRGKHIPAMQWASLGLVTAMGAATLLTGDARFVMIKPTVIYVVIGLAMLEKDWLGRYMPPQARGLIDEKWIILAGYAWAGLMLATAAANLYFALVAGRAAWVVFIGVFPLASKIGLFALTYGGLRVIAVRTARRRAAQAVSGGAVEAQAA